MTVLTSCYTDEMGSHIDVSPGMDDRWLYATDGVGWRTRGQLNTSSDVLLLFGLLGRIEGGRISWSNGAIWTRVDAEAGACLRPCGDVQVTSPQPSSELSVLSDGLGLPLTSRVIRRDGDRTPWVEALAAWLLGPLLQGNYSVALYGAPNRVPLESLKLVWTALLPPLQAERLAAAVGLCFHSAAPPWRPLYVPQSALANPLNSVWVTRASYTAVPNGSWAEVTHCSRGAGRPTSSGPPWFYVAPGSGVSINVGATFVIRAPIKNWTLSRDALRMGIGRGAGGAALVDVDLRRYDSVQIVGKHEEYSLEERHELVMLKLPIDEADALAPALTRRAAPRGRAVTVGDAAVSQGPTVRCGRHPHLYDCDDAPQLAMLASCPRLPYPQLFIGEQAPLSKYVRRCDYREPPPVRGWLCDDQRSTARRV